MFSTLNMQRTSEVCHASATIDELAVSQLLDEADTDEVLRFLAGCPLNGLFLRGHIEDNGFNSQLNRGNFFGVRNPAGALEAVGLIGHATLFEATTDGSLAALASVAQQNNAMHMLLGPHDGVQKFWKYLSLAGRTMRGSCRELLFTNAESAANCDVM